MALVVKKNKKLIDNLSKAVNDNNNSNLSQDSRLHLLAISLRLIAVKLLVLVDLLTIGL